MVCTHNLAAFAGCDARCACRVVEIEDEITVLEECEAVDGVGGEDELLKERETCWVRGGWCGGGCWDGGGSRCAARRDCGSDWEVGRLWSVGDRD